MAHRVDVVWLRCPKGCSLARPVPKRPVTVPCPYHPGCSMELIGSASTEEE